MMFRNIRPQSFQQIYRHKELGSQHCISRALFSTSSQLYGYADTLDNLRIGSHTKLIYQGFTGRQATSNAKASIEWGTKVVGGVSPGKHGEHLGLPLLPDVKSAVTELKPDATAIFVAAQHAAGAIEEAIEAEIPLIAAVAEHIPLHDILRIHSILRSQSKSRLVGANAPGIISAIGKCRIGFQPLSCYTPGRVGVVAKSGTLSYEAVGSLSRAGVGQSLCISVGGDIVAGTNLTEALSVFETDDDTDGIVLIGEVGGFAEEEAAEWIKDYKQRVPNPKPIAGLVAGIHARHDRIMGHAGAFPSPGETSAQDKYRALEAAGVTMVRHPEKFGPVMKGLLGGRSYSTSRSGLSFQQRRYHTNVRPRHTPQRGITHLPRTQRRGLRIDQEAAYQILEDNGIRISQSAPPPNSKAVTITVTVDRVQRKPVLIVKEEPNMSTSLTYSYSDSSSTDAQKIGASCISNPNLTTESRSEIASIIGTLITLFKTFEAIHLTLTISIPKQSTNRSTKALHISKPDLFFDDSAFRSNKRHPELHAKGKLSLYDPIELDAEKDGIVYVPLGSPDDSIHNIGTLVNGAGLAMNTVDALRDHGGYAANFLDTGGKATSETVKASFELILRDPRVKVIFVNIFGGLTLCDMIAEGILLAFRELGLGERGIPVVVRLRGTNEELGQKIVAESGLEVEAFDGFEEAAERVVELAGGK